MAIYRGDLPRSYSALGGMYNKSRHEYSELSNKMMRYGGQYREFSPVQYFGSCRNDRELKGPDSGRKIWYLGETIKRLYELDRNPARTLFLDEYFNFMRCRGTTVTKIPVVAKLPLDLFRLYHVVQKYSGFSQVVKKRRWSRVVRELDLPSSITSAAFTLRTQYMRLLYPYECEKKGIPNNFLFYEEEVDYEVERRGGSPEQPHSSHYESQHSSDNHHTSSPESSHSREQSFEDKSKLRSSFHLSYVDLSAHSEDNICLKSREPYPLKNKLGDLSSPSVKRPKSEELENKRMSNDSDQEFGRPRTWDNACYSNISEEPIIRLGKRAFSVGHEEEVNMSDVPHLERIEPHNNEDKIICENSVHDESGLKYQYTKYPEDFNNASNYKGDIRRKYTNSPSVRNSAFGYYHQHPNPSFAITRTEQSCACADCSEAGKSPAQCNVSPALPENARMSPRYQTSTPPNNVSKLHNNNNPHAFHKNRMGEEPPRPEHDGIHRTRHMDHQASPARNMRLLSTSPSEMNIKIEDRTETAMALSIVVNGIRYTGTLLSNVQR